MCLQHFFGNGDRFFAQPISIVCGDDFAFGIGFNSFAETFVAFDAAGSSFQTFDFADVSAVGQKGLRYVFAAFASDKRVVRADKLRVGIAFDFAVEQDNGNARFVSAFDDVCQRFCFVRRGNKQVYVHLNEVFNVGDLLGIVLRRIRKDDFEHRIVFCGGRYLSVHCDAPGFSEVTLGHTDDEFFAAAGCCRVRRAFCK